MPTIFIASTGGSAGRSLATWALANKLKERALRVGFFKPYTTQPANAAPGEGMIDPDLLLLREVLHLQEPDNLLCPVCLSPEMLSQISKKEAEALWGKIQEAFQEVSRTKDIILAMGGQEIFWGEGSADFSDSILVKKFNAVVLLLDHYQKDNLTMFSLLSLNSFLEGRVRTAFLNHVPWEKIAHLKNKLVPFLQGKGIKAVIPIPEDSILSANSVEAITALIDGAIICGEEYKGNLIKDFTIGAKHLSGALSIFKQVYNRVILLRLSEKEIEYSPVGGIILTGGKKPGEILLRVAQEASLPLILTKLDTFQTVEIIEKKKPVLSVKDSFKVQRFLQLISQESPQDDWLEALL